MTRTPEAPEPVAAPPFPWDESLAAAHRDLSPHDLAWRRLAADHPRLRARRTFHALDREESLFAYLLQSWPTFLGARRSAEMARVSVAVADLVKSFVERVFDRDPQRISDYFGLDDPRAVALAVAQPDGIAGSIGRGDFILTADGFRCIEFNLCSSLGGWESASIAELLLDVPEIADFVAELPVGWKVHNTVRAMFRHAIEEALARGVADREVNFAIGHTVDDDGMVRASTVLARQEFQAALEEVDPSLSGEFLFCDYDGARLDGTRLVFAGRTLHCLLEQHLDMTHPLAFRAQKCGSLLVYNGPVSEVLSDKRNIALLSTLLEGDLLDSAERRLVEEYVPWTRRVEPGTVVFDGEKEDLPRLLLARQERMVLKKAVSLGGKDVFIGRVCEPEEWRRAVDGALADGGWVVQDHVASQPYVFQCGEDGAAVCDVVWGPFIMGSTYAGTILRLQPKEWKGVVNLTRGATEGIVFELEAEGKGGSEEDR